MLNWQLFYFFTPSLYTRMQIATVSARLSFVVVADLR